MGGSLSFPLAPISRPVFKDPSAPPGSNTCDLQVTKYYETEIGYMAK